MVWTQELSFGAVEGGCRMSPGFPFRNWQKKGGGRLQGGRESTLRQDAFLGGTYRGDDSAGSGNSNLVPRTERWTGTQD